MGPELRYGTPPAERLPQRTLAVELRYRIDVARQAERRPVGDEQVSPIGPTLDRVRELVEEHPKGMGSAHVRHNLGPDRLDWLRGKGLLGA